MSEVLICPIGSISKKASRALERAGVIVVESDAPERVQFIRSSEVISGDDLMWAALAALNKRFPYGDSTKNREEFVNLMFLLHDDARRKRLGEAISVDAVDPAVTK